MLVGEVRCATFTGCSCTLSGGSQWSSGPTYVSKYAHVFRASLRRKFVWSTVSLALRRASGRLIHQAIAGDAPHSNKIGPAIDSTAGSVSERPTQVATAIAGATPIER